MSNHNRCAVQGCKTKPYPGLSKCGAHMSVPNVTGIPTGTSRQGSIR